MFDLRLLLIDLPAESTEGLHSLRDSVAEA